MISTQAIEKAYIGGWHWNGDRNKNLGYDWELNDFLGIYENIDGVTWQEVALDPEFWRALSKALKFDQPIWFCESNKVMRVGEGKELGPRCEDPHCGYAGWKDLNPASMYGEVHKFLDLILTGGDTEKFWADLLK